MNRLFSRKLWLYAWVSVLSISGTVTAKIDPEHDIRKFTTHFQAGNDPGPWTFSPPNTHMVSTDEFPGLLTIRHSGADVEFKGTLKEPLPLADYPPPWDFEIDVLHSFWTKCAGGQINVAVGLNVALTFSDPSTWPKDRSIRPPDTHDFQLLIVHLGSRFGPGLPMYKVYHHPERFLVWGRGDLAPELVGDWEIPTIDVGDGQQDGGPATTDAYLRLRIFSPTGISFATRFEQARAFNQRYVDVSKFGKITGVWEIGPVVPSSSWITTQWPGSEEIPSEPTPKLTDVYIGFCDFRYAPPFPSFDCISNDFNIPGFMGGLWSEFHGLAADNLSNPGYLTYTLRGGANATGGSATEGYKLMFSDHPPPWEIEVCFIAPDDTIPWDFLMNWTIFDKDENKIGAWTPGMVNIPGEGGKVGHVGFHMDGAFVVEGGFGPSFPNGVPESILSAKPMYMLIRMIDTRRMQMGVKARPEDPWFLSTIYETTEEIAGYGEHAFSFHTWKGSPAYQKFLIDYWHYRYGISGPLE
jgi:hypothetical protein